MNNAPARLAALLTGILFFLWSALVVWALDRWDSAGGAFLPTPPATAAAPAGPRAGLPDWSSLFGVPGVSVHAWRVRPGDTLEGLAARFGLKVGTLLSLNRGLGEKNLEPGEILLVPSRDGAFHTLQEGQGLSDVARAYGVSLGDLLAANPAGPEGLPGPGRVLFLPGAAHLPSDDPRWKTLTGLVPRRGFRKPTGGRFADGFGPRRHPLTGRESFHTGLDLAPGSGARVFAAEAGRVVFAGIRAGYGRLVVLDHGGGLTSWYAHLSEIAVEAGKVVDRGDLLGKVGASGRATGPHLHFEVRQDGKPRNPLLYLQNKG